ncbi:hypothetical protein pipiens_013730 [Culex pipiens pipiens]|uniref:WD repeat-containing protein 55 homolog n=1 Tax=Culex pipiens pipiens TaxID=38569 RepID=A0ABD1CYI5_CULPP
MVQGICVKCANEVKGEVIRCGAFCSAEVCLRCSGMSAAMLSVIRGSAHCIWICTACKGLVNKARFSNSLVSVDTANMTVTDSLKTEIKDSILAEIRTEIRKEIREGFKTCKAASSQVSSSKRAREDESNDSSYASALKKAAINVLGLPVDLKDVALCKDTWPSLILCREFEDYNSQSGFDPDRPQAPATEQSQMIEEQQPLDPVQTQTLTVPVQQTVSPANQPTPADVAMETTDSDYHVIAVSETWLRDGILDSELSSNYQFFRKDRSPATSELRRGGGCLVAVKNGLDATLVKLAGYDHLEQTIIRVKVRRQNVFLCCIYIRPNSPNDIYLSHYAAVREVLSKADVNDLVIVVGDYNLPGLRWTFDDDVNAFIPNNASTEIELDLMESLLTSGMQQVCNLSNARGNILDLAFVNDADRVDLIEPPSAILKPDRHHKQFVLKVDIHHNPDQVSQHSADVADFDFNRCDHVAVTDALNQIDWDNVLNSEDANTQASQFYSVVFDVIQQLVPRKRIARDRSIKQPWWNAELRHKRNILRKARKRLFRSKSPEDNVCVERLETEYELLNETLYHQNRPKFVAVTSLEDVQAVRCAEFHPNGRIYAVGSNSKTFRICEYPPLSEIREDHTTYQPTVLFKRTKHHKGSIYCMAWSPVGDLIATGSNDKTVKLMRFNENQKQLEGQEIELTMHDGTVRDLCFLEDTSNKSSLLISGGAGDCKIYVTDCETSTPFQALSGHGGHVLSLYNWGSVMFVSGSMDKSVRFWDLRTRGCVNMVTPATSPGSRQGSPVAAVCVDPSGRLLVSGHEDSSCVLYDIRGNRPIQCFKPHASDVRSIRFSPSAYYLLTAGYDNKLVLTDLQGDLTMPLPSVVVAQHADKVISGRWHPVDFSFLSTSADKTATLWALPPI